MKRLGKSQLSIIMEGNVGKVMKGGKLIERVQFEEGDNLVEAVEKLKKGHLLEGSSMTEDEWFKNVKEIQNDKVLDSLIVKMWKLLKRLDMKSYNRKIDAVNQFTGLRYRDWETTSTDRKSTRLNSSHSVKSRMPSSA